MLANEGTSLVRITLIYLVKVIIKVNLSQNDYMSEGWKLGCAIKDLWGFWANS